AWLGKHIVLYGPIELEQEILKKMEGLSSSQRAPLILGGRRLGGRRLGGIRLGGKIVQIAKIEVTEIVEETLKKCVQNWR
ncbi:hypothetical protein ACJX0J_007383, partial [Zea mays]